MINFIKNNMSELLNKLIQDQIEQLELKKEEIIKTKLEEKGFYSIVTDNPKRRFKKMMIENHPDCEKYFVDDGSINGHLLVTFYKPIFDTSSINKGFNMNISLKYE